jgi:predicted CopG family antitoxin
MTGLSRTITIDAKLYDALRAQAKKEGTSFDTLVAEALTKYLRSGIRKRGLKISVPKQTGSNGQQ